MSAASLLLAVLLLCPCLGAQEGKELAPSFSPDSIVNSADGSSSSLAPNVLATIYGKNLSFDTSKALLGLQVLILPFALGNVRVTVGGIVAPLLYVSPTQINFLIPANFRATKTTVTVFRETNAAQAQVTLLDVAPALFLVEGGKLAATHASGQLITTDAPALPGEIIVVWGDGFGPTDPKQVDNNVLHVAAPIVAMDQFRVLLAEQLLPAASLLYAGASPGYPGLYQANIRLPAIILTKQPTLRVGFENQMSQSGLVLEVAPNEP